jgi:hypothetical protein
VPVAEREGAFDGPDALLPGELPSAKAQLGNLLSLDPLIV